MDEETMKTVTILLTRYSDLFGRFIWGISRHGYSHASISIDSEVKISRFLEKKEQYIYSRWGVVLCLMHIPHKFRNRYFCSQFVAEILSRAGAVELKKKESLYMPGQLFDDMECVFSQKQLVYNII